MIVTVTMNPALDRTAETDRVRPGALNRLKNVRVDAGGKGVNVSKLAAALGAKTVCVGFIGGESGRELARRVEELGIEQDFIEIGGVTRQNLKVVDANGGLTEFNEPGMTVSESELDALLEKTVALARRGVVVLSGSPPSGANKGVYRRFAERLRSEGCSVILDADGEAFKRGIEAPPHVVKPNRFELLQYYGLPEDTPDDGLPALCRELVDGKGVDLVVLSMGADGAMFFSRERSARAGAVPVRTRSTVGAGDSMVGAVAYALSVGLDFEEMIRLAMAASAGAAAEAGTVAPSPETIKELKARVVISEVKP
jgi:1-phosphofructokinase